MGKPELEHLFEPPPNNEVQEATNTQAVLSQIEIVQSRPLRKLNELLTEITESQLDDVNAEKQQEEPHPHEETLNTIVKMFVDKLGEEAA